MATTVNDVQLSLAYRLGESRVPTNTNEKAKRLRFIQEGYRALLKRHYWWFTEKTTSLETVSGKEQYGTSDGLPTDLRDVIEVRVDNDLYEPLPSDDAFGELRYPPQYYAYPNITFSKYWFMFEGELHLLPNPSSTPSSKSITSINRSGTVATVVATSHGFQTNDYVKIEGSDQPGYNSTFRVTRVDDNTFTFIVTSSPSTPATGTMTATKQNLVIRYFHWPTMPSADADTFLLPDHFTDALVAFAYARVMNIDAERGSASDGFDEYEEIVKEIFVEENKRKFYGKAVHPYDYGIDY